MMRRRIVGVGFLLLFVFGHDRGHGPLASSQAPGAAGAPQSAGTIVRLDSALERIVPAGAKIEKLAGGFGFTEGPLWAHDGALLFSDVRGNKIYRLVPGGEATVFRSPGGYDGMDAPAGALIGSNGLTFDQQGRLIICETGNRRVTRLAGGQLTVLADKYDGKRLNSPNDVVVKSDGSIYFTDPPYGFPKQDDDPQKELSFNGIYRIANGKLELLGKDLSRPNGLGFSPDEKYLYVANGDAARKILMRFEVKQDGTLGAGTVFYDLSAEKAPGIPDGLKLDSSGNVYLAGPGGVWIISPEAKTLGRIEAPEGPANVGWGDDGKSLYLTARTSIYRIRLNATGKRP